ncbi:MAG: hypothetical protein GY696_02240 [Gammaproteobacteria bacterium]|nr:hypothetical protein [Gammaproteobacteria bacterium]
MVQSSQQVLSPTELPNLSVSSLTGGLWGPALRVNQSKTERYRSRTPLAAPRGPNLLA